jgi:hypothetical protein
MQRTCILRGKEKVTYTIICMRSYYLLIYQVKNVVGYPDSNKLTWIITILRAVVFLASDFVAVREFFVVYSTQNADKLNLGNS